MHELADIESQPASTLVCDHLICVHCSRVRRDPTGTQIGRHCQSCGKIGEGGRLFFHSGISILVDLAQQAYNSQSLSHGPSAPDSRDISTLIFFCALRESLLDNFLLFTLRSQSVPQRVIEQLFSDNRLANQKFGALFTTVSGHKWDHAVALVGGSSGDSYQKASKFMLKASKLRNDFLHDGVAWGVTRMISTTCINTISPMIELFVALHNEFAIRSQRSVA